MPTMTTPRSLTTLAAAALLLQRCAAAPAPSYFVAATNASAVRLVGRWLRNATDGSAVGDWAGVSAEVTVNASAFTWLAAHIEDGCSGNKFAVSMRAQDMTGDRPLRVSTLYTSPTATRYILFASAGRLSLNGSAVFRLTKAVEARFTQCTLDSPLKLLGFEADAPFLPAPAAPNRRLLVLGDSISSGDLLECCPTASGCAGALPLANSLWADDVTLTYGSLLATALGADAHTISWGGIGVAAGDTPSWTWPTLPDAYNWTLGWAGLQAGGPGVAPLLPWDNAAYVPQGIVANLGTNDAAGGRFNNATFAAVYEARYVQLLRAVSDAATAAGAPSKPPIFLGYGPMTTAYEAAAANVTATLVAAGYPAQLLNLTLPSPCGCGHPSAQDHAVLAARVQPAVAAALGW